MQEDEAEWYSSEIVENYISSDQHNLFPDLGDTMTCKNSKVKIYSQHDIDNFDQIFGSDIDYEKRHETHGDDDHHEQGFQNVSDCSERSMYIANELAEQCVHNTAERGATSLPIEHRHLIDTLLDRPTVDGKYTAAVPPQPTLLEIDKTDLDYFHKLLVESKSKTDFINLQSSSAHKRDTDWINVFEKYVSKVNDSCVFMYQDHHFSASKSNKQPVHKQFIMSADAKCKFSACTCSFHAIVLSNGELVINFKGNIVHSPSEQRARPIRGTYRRSVAETLMNGVSPDQLRLKKLGTLTDNNRLFGNYNSIGSSPHVFRKIRSEAKTSLILDKDVGISLEKIKEQQAKEINAGKLIPGYLQTITISPLRLVLFTEGSLILWNQVGYKVPVSWDATGGIVMNRGKRVFYYELTITNIATRSLTTKNSSGPSFPITAMLSTTHTTMDLVQWLQEYEAAYRKLYGFKFPFPKPPIVHSDGALVFQMAAMRFFNGDTTINSYLKRCWTIVNRTATYEDLSKTIVHSCLSHFSKSVKRQALQYFPKKKAPFALWIMSLLINSNSLEEMCSMWEHICIVLLSATQSAAYSLSISCLSAAADNMNKDPDKDNFIVRNVKVDSKGECQYSTTFDQILAETIDDEDEADIGLSEQAASSESESPFRDCFTKIYSDQEKICVAFSNDNVENSMENPYYNPAYLKRILSLYLPIAPIWSNLLMGNLSRYGYRTSTGIEHCGCHNSRTTGVSESRLRVVKNTVLRGEVSSRIDQVIQILGSNIRQTEINFSNYYLLNLTKNRTARAKKLLAEESWNKRGPPKPSTTSIYSEKPKVSIVTQLKNAVMAKTSSHNQTSASRKMNQIQFKPHSMFGGQRLCWLNAAVQLVLSNNALVAALMKSTFFRSTMSTNNNRAIQLNDTDKEDDAEISSHYSMMEQKTIQYLCELLKLKATQPLKKSVIHDYIEELRKHGPKLHVTKTNEYVPIIRPIGEISCIHDYLSNILLHTLSNFIDIPVICHELFSCSHCRTDRLIVIEQHLMLELRTTNCEGKFLPTAALKNYFSDDKNNNTKSCNTCGTRSNRNQSSREIVQLPDSLFLAFAPPRFNTQTKNQVQRTEFFIENTLDLSEFISSSMICYPSYTKYKLNSIVICTGNDEDSRHYYTFAKHYDQFFRCNDAFIEPVDKSVVFKSQYSTSIAMYTREKHNDCNFVEIISQILFEAMDVRLLFLVSNTHFRMMFDAALEFISRKTKTLSWTYGASYTCFGCKQKNHIFGNDCLLFSNQLHMLKNNEISLDATLFQTKLVPRLRCKNNCENYDSITTAYYSIFEIPRLIFLTFAVKSLQNTTQTSTKDQSMRTAPEQISIKCDILQCCYTYDLLYLIVLTKDEQVLLVKKTSNDEYSVLNQETKVYEHLKGYRFNDFITAAATNIVLCYKTNDTTEIIPDFKSSAIDTSMWTDRSNIDPNTLIDAFNRSMSKLDKPLKIGPYQLTSMDINNLIEPTYQLNDELLNAHLYTTTKLSDGVVLFDSIQLARNRSRGFMNVSEITNIQWFNNNIILLPVHHLNHWALFIIDIVNTTIIFFNSLQSNTASYETHKNAIIQLLRTHYFYTTNKKLSFNDWNLISRFDDFQQDDATSCGVHCGLFARSYVTQTKHPKIMHNNITNHRLQFALHLLQQNQVNKQVYRTVKKT